VLGLALLMYADPGPLMPILDTWWRTFHVSLLVGAMGVFAAGFLFTSLYLMADTGRGGTVTGGREHGPDGPDGVDVGGDTGGGGEVGGDAGVRVGAGVRAGTGGADVAVAARASGEVDAAERAAMRARIPAVKLAIGTFIGTSLVSWVWPVSMESTVDGMRRMLTVNIVMVVAALVARHFAPYLPSTDVLDSVGHRLIAFAFVLWTVGTIAGAMWAEQSWGRFWGWDPKETGAFLTWIAYAGYLHGRATRGIRGRSAAWIGVGAFVTLMATYLVANYVIVGLHSYAGL
jgi:ABC-type transport system involved in cytochrome c biogenesis permease subunit